METYLTTPESAAANDRCGFTDVKSVECANVCAAIVVDVWLGGDMRGCCKAAPEPTTSGDSGDATDTVPDLVCCD